MGALVGAAVTMLGQTLADRRARRIARRELHDEELAKSIAELRKSFEDQGRAIAELRGIVVGRRTAGQGERDTP